MMKAFALLALFVAASLPATDAAAQATLNSVKQKGVLTCGSNRGAPGFGAPDAQGNWSGLDVDLCRAIAAAIFDDPTKVQFVPLSAQDRFTLFRVACAAASVAGRLAATNKASNAKAFIMT